MEYKNYNYFIKYGFFCSCEDKDFIIQTHEIMETKFNLRCLNKFTLALKSDFTVNIINFLHIKAPLNTPLRLNLNLRLNSNWEILLLIWATQFKPKHYKA